MHSVAQWMIIVTILLISNSAYAYIGPGAGLSVIGSVVALLGAILLLLVGFVWYPIKRVLKRKKTNVSAVEAQTRASTDYPSNQGAG